jgi:branched-chain amino acid transport system ATP-binding protein
MPLLSVRNVSLSIQNQQILKNVSLDVAEGEVVGLIGPNGSGKTTFFNVLSGFLGVSDGAILLEGQDVTRMSATNRARIGVGRVFQNFGIFREMTLVENVLVALFEN